MIEPRILEDIVFLKYSQRSWDDNLAAEAVQCAPSKRSQKRLDEFRTQLELDSDDTI